MIPSFLLAKLYVKGSLKNNDTGFEFNLKNIIDPTMIIGIGPINVGEKSYESDSISMILAEKTYPGAELSRENSVLVRVGIPITVKVAGERLQPGIQKVSVSATTSDIGRIKFDLSDTAS